MHPSIELDDAIVAQNARAWRAFCAPAKLYAVVKANGYGWSVERLVRALEAECDAFCVSDAEELYALRACTQKRAIVLGAVADDELPGVLAANALPTMETQAQVRVGIAHGAVRLGVRPAAAWSGSLPEELAALAPLLAQSGVPVQLWTHVTDSERRSEQIGAFESAHTELRAAGVRIAETDLASTFALSAGCRNGTSVRIGIGLFGATGGRAINGVQCALRVEAPVVRLQTYDAGSRLGYGGTMLAAQERVITARCGYADGIPQTLEGSDDILSVGMQYITVRGERATTPERVTLLDRSTNLDRFAAAAGRLPHDIVTALGNASR